MATASPDPVGGATPTVLNAISPGLAQLSALDAGSPTMPKGPVPAVPVVPARWHVDIWVRGNLLLSQEAALKGWIATRRGLFVRTLEGHEDTAWHGRFSSTGANGLLVHDWVSQRLRALCPGDRIDAVKIEVKRATP